MRDKDRELAEKCKNWVSAARQAEKWLQHNRACVGGECELLCKDVRHAARAFKKLATAASRKMCVGVFGPSQAGKSYLISALARDRSGELLADFAGRDVDFIRQINPAGGKESTGLVTRFTTTKPAGVTETKPVHLRLFSEMDLVRVFANTYYADCDHKQIPNQEELITSLHNLEKAAGETTGKVIADDVEDLREYLQKNFASRPRVQLLQRVFWNKAIELAPRLTLENRVQLFGCIWENTPEFDAFFLKLAMALEQLGHASEAICQLETLLPREKSIIDVSMLRADSEGADEKMEIEGLGGNTSKLSRSVITAITAEITIYMPVRPDNFFEYTDLLDFPGYRSRLKVSNLRQELVRKGQLEHFFLRGKVAYLFERYCDEQELTGMLLCIGPSNQDVQDLPSAINTWISLTQGESPEERKGHEPTLFFVLTMMDREFERKLGEENSELATDTTKANTNAEKQNRWDTRLFSSLTGFFGAQYDWPSNWDGKPFCNLFLLRNPNYRCDAIFSFDPDGKENGIRSDMENFVANVRSSFLSSETVKQHFTHPAEAWDAAMKFNDGGISLLRKKLAPICDPDRKYIQTKERAADTAKRTAARLAAYYRSDDLEKLREQKKQIARQLMEQLIHVISRQQFADLLRRLQVSDYVLYEMASDCEAITDQLQNSIQIPTATVVGSSISVDELMGDLFTTEAEPAQEPNFNEGQKLIKKQEEEEGQDQIDIFCRRVVNYWFEQVRAVAANPILHRLYKLPSSTFTSFINELILSARHSRLLENMEMSIREHTAFRNIARDLASWRMASEAAYHINSFVDWLGHDLRLEQPTEIVYNGSPIQLFTPPSISYGEHGDPLVSEQPEQYDRAYYTDWLRALYDCVTTNISEPEEKFDPVQNNRLGDILKLFTCSDPSLNPI